MNVQSKSQRYFQLALLILAAGSIYPLLYLRTQFQEPILTAFNIDIAQLSVLYSRLGWMFVIGYLPSGWLADRISAKILIVFSLASTAAVGVWYAQLPSFASLQIIFALWGITAVLTFWSSLLKAVKLLSTPEDEGRVFGALDGGRGLVEAVLGTIAITLFAVIATENADVASTQAGLKVVIYMYVVALLLLSVLIWIFLTESFKI